MNLENVPTASLVRRYRDATTPSGHTNPILAELLDRADEGDVAARRFFGEDVAA